MRKFAPLLLLFALGCAPGSMPDLALPADVSKVLDAPDATEFVFLSPTPLDESKPLPRIGPFQVTRSVKPPEGKEGEVAAYLRFASLAPGATSPEKFAPRYGAILTKGGEKYGFALDFPASAYKVYDAEGKEMVSGTLGADAVQPEEALPWLNGKDGSVP